MQDKIPIGISFPKEVISRIDSERGDVPRSRYILRIVETNYKIRSREKDCSKEKNNSDLLEGRFESLHPSESQSTIEDVISNGQTVDRDIPEWLKNLKPTIENVPIIPSPEFPPEPVITTVRVERNPGTMINPRTGRPYELPTKSQVDLLATITNFQDFTAYLEGIHGLPHIWVGGTMATYRSPADPLFWLHHANIDRLWALWPNSQSERPSLQEINSQMAPWSYRTDRDQIEDTKIFGYTYE